MVRATRLRHGDQREPDVVDQDPWRAVVAALRQKIESGAYEPQRRLPTMDALMAEYGVTSRPAMQKVLAQLAADGLIVTVRRQGACIRRYDPSPWTIGHQHGDADTNDDFNAWAAEVTAHGGVPSRQTTTTTGCPPGVVARRLRLPDGTAMAVRRQIRSVNGVPTQTVATYQSEMDSRVLPRRVDEIAARMPTPQERDRLDLPPGTPVAEHTRTWYDEDGAAQRTTVTIVRGDEHTLVYEFPPADQPPRNST
jgi:GntR family transcriptional regulator